MNENEKQVFEKAKMMFLQDKGRKEVMDYMYAYGISDARSETLATEAFLAFKDQRRQMIAEANPEEEPMGGGGMGSVVIGALIMIGGIVATMSSNSIFYGAILVGLFTMISGFFKR